MNVPLFDMRAELAPLRAEIDRAIARVLDSGVFVNGPEVTGFEGELATAAGARHAIGVSSGTDALLVTMMAMGIGAGDEVVTTPLTFAATANAAVRLGAKVVFADIDDATSCLDPQRALAACTDRTRAIVTVHLYGHPAAIPEGVPVIEDAAHSLIAIPVRGVAAALSFFPTKNMGALGDAGAVITNDPAIADRIALLRSHGSRPKYHQVAVGGNFRLDAIQAAVLRVKLAHLAAWNAKRRAHADHYRALLGHLPIRLPIDHPAHAYHQFCIRTPRRDELRDRLASAGVGTEVYYPEPLHLAHGGRLGDCPIAERACGELLALPIHPQLTDAAIEYVAGIIATALR